jgi:hypothetical protein
MHAKARVKIVVAWTDANLRRRSPPPALPAKLFQAVGVVLPPNLQEIPARDPAPAA